MFNQLFLKLSKLFFCIFLICPYSLNPSEVSKLLQLPHSDRARIEKLLSFLVWDEGFAYVLFGDKPMSRVSQDKTLPSSYQRIYKSPALELESLWNTWEKYAQLFPMEEFIFVSESDEKWFNLYLFKKANCLKVINDNLFIFQEKIGLKLNAAEIFNYIVSSGSVFKVGLNKSQALVGILFGYGSKNALGYENYYSLKKDHFPQSLEHIKTNEFKPLILPCFASFSEEETQNLLANYQKQREEILKVYSHQNFLETTISRLIERTNNIDN